MIKGINRHMIEITDTKSEYYERAILFIKPRYESLENKILEKEAQNIIKALGAPSIIKKKNKFLYWSIRILPVVIITAAVTYFVLSYAAG
ncbi:MAG: hypothetical protein Q4B14_03960 [Clostridia bacterium]|nr:hypothetical protein [Clostridia bacterium]